jgi:hypothetical protein
MTTPPGWYPEPGQTDGPGLERWWNGTEWTEYTRTPTATAAAPGYPPQPGGYPGYPAYPGFPGDQPPARRRRGVIAAAVVAGVVVVGAIAAGAVALSGGHSDSNSAGKPGSAQHRPGRTGQGPGTSGGLPGGSSGGADGGSSGGSGGSGGSAGGSSGGESPQPGQSALPKADAGYVADDLDGIELPVPKGWKGATASEGYASLTVSPYHCPGDSSSKDNCVRGGVNAIPAAGLGVKATTAKAAATADISKNASDSYGEDSYGGVVSHQQLAARKVTVAGQSGYLVRWKVVTKKGVDGYVESAAFPSPVQDGDIVIVRFGFDVDPKAPGVSVMDTILSGVRSLGGSSGGTGV